MNSSQFVQLDCRSNVRFESINNESGDKENTIMFIIVHKKSMHGLVKMIIVILKITSLPNTQKLLHIMLI